MTSPAWSSLLDLYQQTVSTEVLRYLQKQAGMKVKRGIYGAQVVLWLMMLQRLPPCPAPCSCCWPERLIRCWSAAGA
jgi:hypothetical protein